MVSLLLSTSCHSLINGQPEVPQGPEPELPQGPELPQEPELPQGPEPLELPPPSSGNQPLRPETMPLLAQEEKIETYAYLNHLFSFTDFAFLNDYRQLLTIYYFFHQNLFSKF
jgi:hypothetical protein